MTRQNDWDYTPQQQFGNQQLPGDPVPVTYTLTMTLDDCLTFHFDKPDGYDFGGPLEIPVMNPLSRITIALDETFQWAFAEGPLGGDAISLDNAAIGTYGNYDKIDNMTVRFDAEKYPNNSQQVRDRFNLYIILTQDDGSTAQITLDPDILNPGTLPKKSSGKNGRTRKSRNHTLRVQSAR